MARPELISLLRPRVTATRATLADARGASAVGTLRAGAAAVGASAVGAFAVGAAAVGRLAIKRAAVKRLEIDELVVRRLQVDARGGVTRERVADWVAGYERAWRTPGTDALLQLFTPKATYSPGPFAPTLRGLPAIAEFWEAGRESADDAFTLTIEPVAVDDATAVVQTEVDYVGIPESRQYRNLWVLAFAPDGRVQAFEEWPFRPERPPIADAT
jgi:hypothetical protein